MMVLGICAYHGDCSASIVVDGKLAAAVEEERFTRVKHWAGFPEHSIKYCLKEAHATLDDVDYIAVARDTKANIKKKVAYVLRSPSFWKKLRGISKNRKIFQSFEELFARAFNVDPEPVKAKIRPVEHHLAHLASTYFVSPFDKAALVSVDGLGDFASAMYGVGQGNKIEPFQRVYSPHSIGLFYTMITQFLGFKKYGDEYKVMGLASYGEPEYLKEMEDIIAYTGAGNYKLNMKYFDHHRKKLSFNWKSGVPEFPDIYSGEFVKAFGKPRDPEEPVTDFHKNFAASMQKHTENILFHIMNYVHERVNIDSLCLAGGVAMNSVANGKIFANTPFKDVYIPPAAGDAGTSMGAAFYTWNHQLGNKKSFVLDTGYWGPGFEQEEIDEVIAGYKDQLDTGEFHMETVTGEDQLVEKTVDFIAEGNVVGWFQGRMEFGARALGNRSIVVDPRRTDMKDILNARIKKREMFRPFAPSIIIEKVPDWFESSYHVPFMEKVYVIKEEKREQIPAVTHVDGTGRLQTVEKSHNPLYYKLIDTFGKKTGVPIVLNTSFNENEPIVATPSEALDAFLRTKMDVVVLGRTIIKRK